MTPGGERSGSGGLTCRVCPAGKGFGGERLGGAGVGVGSVGVGALPAHRCAAAAPGEAFWARAGSVARARGVLGATAWPARAVARLARSVVSAPRAPSLLSSAAAVAPGKAPGARAGDSPRAGGAPGAAFEAAVRLAGAAFMAPCAAWAAGAAPLAGAGPGVDSPVSAEAAQGLPGRRPNRHRRLCQPQLLALREGLPRISRGDGGAGAGPSVVAVVPLGGAIRVCHPVIMMGMRGGRCAPPITSRCICVVPWAVLCSALQGGGGEGRGGRRRRYPCAGGGWRPSIGTGPGCR